MHWRPRSLISLLFLICVLPAGGIMPVWGQTRPKVEVPATTTHHARQLVQQLLKTGRIIRSSAVRRGMKGEGHSVFQGTHIEKFPVEVLGVLSRVQGGGDLVLIKVTGGTVIRRNSGIIAGMSGSPVYINGKLLGAISSGWGFPREPIGGVTPITEMIETSLPDPARARPSGRATPPRPGSSISYNAHPPLQVAGRRVAEVVVNPREGGWRGSALHLRPASLLLQVNGFSPASVTRLQTILEPYNIQPVIGPSSRKTGVKPAFVPGGAIGVQLVSGDMDQTAVGTITFRQGNRILAFGHPMFGQGAASLPMATAFIHEIFPSYQRSFKLASPVQVVGALQQDTQFAIGGTVGMKADTIPMTIALRDTRRQIARRFAVRVMKDPVLTPRLIGVVASEAIETTLGLTSDKMVRVGLRMKIANAPEIVRRNLIYSNGVVTGAALDDLGETLAITQLNEFARGSVQQVSLDVAVEHERRIARIKQLFANRNRVKAGEQVAVSAVLERLDAPDQTETHTFTFQVPEDAPSGVMRIAAGTGSEFFRLRMAVGGDPPRPTNLAELVAAWGQIGAMNELLLQVSRPERYVKVDRQKLSDPPAAWMRLLQASPASNTMVYNEVETRRVMTGYALFGNQMLALPVQGRQLRDRDDAVAEQRPVPGTPSPTPTPTRTPGPPGGVPDSTRSVPGQGVDFSFTGTFDRSEFLEQLRSWNEMADEVPPRNRGERPVTGTGGRPAPSPSPAPTGTPTPTPTPRADDSRAPGRPGQSWKQEGPAEFLKGTFEGTLAASDGAVQLAPAARQLATTAEIMGWSIAPGRNGSVYLGTGTRARILKIDEGGAVTDFYRGRGVAITALATGTDGDLYAGMVPGGDVLRLGPTGQIKATYATGERYIWKLGFDNSGQLLAATGGQSARLWRLENEKWTLALTLPQKHLRSFTRYEKTWYLGTADEGVLYESTESAGKFSAPRALYQVVQEGRDPEDLEISALAATARGVFFGTATAGTIWRWSAKEGVQAIYPSPQRAVYDLTAAPDGVVYAATGDRGVVYRLKPSTDGASVQAARLLEPLQLQSLALAWGPGQELLVGTGNNAAAYRIATGRNTGGTYTSTVFDAKSVVRWGALRLLGEGARVETRSGNTVEPDAAWSEWARPREVAGELQVVSPPARYLQYRAVFPTEGTANMSLHRVEMFYRTENQPPALTLSTPRGGEFWSGKKKITWSASDPQNDTLRYEVFISADGGKTWTAAGNTGSTTNLELDTTKWKDGSYLVRVRASDWADNPDDPQDTETTSLPLTLDNTAPEITSSILTRSQAGWRLEISARDGMSPLAGAGWRWPKTEKPKEATALTATLVAAGAVTTSGERQESDDQWFALAAEDGLFDSRSERAFAPIRREGQDKPAEDKAPVVELRVLDAAGNSATRTVEVR